MSMMRMDLMSSESVLLFEGVDLKCHGDIWMQARCESDT